MLLIVTRSKRSAIAVDDLMHYMGVLTYLASPSEALNEISHAYRAVLIIDPHTLPAPEDFVAKIRSYTSTIPIFSISEDGPKNPYAHLFNGAFKMAISSAIFLSRISKICVDLGLASVGDYRLAGINACADEPCVTHLDKDMQLTKTESMILRYLMRTYPLPQKANDILKHAFKFSKRPEPSTIKTHISVMNKKFRELRGRNLIIMYDHGYVVFTPEINRQIKCADK